MWRGHDVCAVFMKIEIATQVLLDAEKWNFIKFLPADFEFACANTEGPKEGKSVTGVKECCQCLCSKDQQDAVFYSHFIQ
jgi:hypothetical protein